MESLNCKVCQNPTFLCQCSREWSDFEKLKGLGFENEKIKYTDLSISTMTVCFNFDQAINLRLLHTQLSNLVDTKYSPGSKKSKVSKKKGTDSFYNSFVINLSMVDRSTSIFSNVNIFIFPNGKVKATGVKTVNTINVLVDELIEIIISVEGSVNDPVSFKAENIKIEMINSNFTIKPNRPGIGWCLRQQGLKDLLVNNYGLSATFSSLSRYPGINLKIPSQTVPGKQVSLLIFRSGSIIITGAKNPNDIFNSYNFITKIVSEHYSDLFYHDINQELKQTKKLNQRNTV